MNRMTLYEKGLKLLEQAEAEADPDKRKLIMEVAAKYFAADIKMKTRQKNDVTKDLAIVLVFFIVIGGLAYLAFNNLNFWSASGVVIGTFALSCLMMGVVLRIRGDISENSLIIMTQEGFKALLLLRKSEKDKTAGKSGSKSRKKK